MTPLRTFAIAALSFFLSHSAPPCVDTGFEDDSRSEEYIIYHHAGKRDFGGCRLWIWRERFFCLFSPSIIPPPTKKLHKNQIIQTANKEKKSEISLSTLYLSSSHLLLIFFFRFFFSKTSLLLLLLLKRKGGDTKNAPPKFLSIFFVIHPSSSSSIIMGARSEIAMGGADVMTFVRSTRPGFPEGLKVRLLFFFFSLSHLFERRRRRPLFKLFSMVLVGGGGTFTFARD